MNRGDVLLGSVSLFAFFPAGFTEFASPAYTGIQAFFRLTNRKGDEKMLRSLEYASLGTLFTFLMTTLGAASVFFFRKKTGGCAQHLMLGFAAGVMTAASVWSLLLPAIEQAEAEGHYPAFLPACAGMALGALFLAMLDVLTPRLRRSGEESEAARSSRLLITAITLHNIPEGMAVGLAFALAADGDSFAAACALALGIGVQNFPEGAAISLPLREMGVPRAKAFARGTLSGAVEPLFGVAVVLVSACAHALMPWLLSFAAGAMLYVVAEELLPRAHGRGGSAGFIGGFLLMMALDVALG